MKKKRFPTQILLLLATIMFWGIDCSRNTIVQRGSSETVNSDEYIFVNSDKYILHITKSSGDVHLYSKDNSLLATFPLHAHPGSTRFPDSQVKLNWQIKKNDIRLKMFDGETPYQNVVIKTYPDAFEVTFEIKYTPQDTGVAIFKKGASGLKIDGLQSTFSPEPDNYNSSIPQIDIRVDRDEQWIFSPAPLNLSFQSNDKWFSIGLAGLPDATNFSYSDDAIYINYTWKQIAPLGIFYSLPPLIFTFNESSDVAVHDYRNYLDSHEFLNGKRSQISERPQWWSNPVVCTRGEQKIRFAEYDSENYTSKWVKKYVIDQQKLLDELNFNLLIEDKWSRAMGDPHPDKRFSDLKDLIHFCQEREHKVLLTWQAWTIEARSLAVQFDIGNTEITDATHPNFVAFMDSCCHFIFGNGGNRLNADGIKVNHLFDVRHPAQGKYRDASLGIGMNEAYRYMQILYKHAKKYKKDCLIISSAAAPQFFDVQDMVALNDDWDNKLRREKRARIISQALPELLIFADAINMYNNIAIYHYTTSSLYGVPTISYSTQFADGDISQSTRSVVNKLLKFCAEKPHGRNDFIDYGHWEIKNGDEILAECVSQGKAIIFYSKDQKGTLLSTSSGSVTIALNNLALTSATDVDGGKVRIRDHGQQIYEMLNLRQGKIYNLSFRRSRPSFE